MNCCLPLKKNLRWRQLVEIQKTIWIERHFVKIMFNTVRTNGAGIYSIKQGWGPLCEFLGHPVSEGIPFPHVHTRAKIQGDMCFLRVITWI
jgi:hypothetical protein